MSQALRILVVEPAGNLYGSELYLLDLLRGLDKTRFAVEVVLPRDTPLIKVLEASHIPALPLLEPPRSGVGKLQKLSAYARLLAHMVQASPHIVFINQAGILRPLALLSSPLRIPLVCNVTTIEDALWVRAHPNAQRNVRAFVCPSEFVRESLRTPSDRTSVVYNGYRRKGMSILPKARSGIFVAGIIGRICAQKGHIFLIEVAARLKASKQDAIRFVFIGDAASDMERAAFQARIRAAGVEDRIEWRGYCENIAAELARLDLLLMPYQGDTFGRTLSEAAEAQVPVLLADSGGPAELARRFGLGVLFNLNDIDEFMQRLHEIINHYDEVKSDFVAGAQHLLNGLEPMAWTRVLESIIERAATGKNVALDWYGAGGNKAHD